MNWSRRRLIQSAVAGSAFMIAGASGSRTNAKPEGAKYVCTPMVNDPVPAKYAGVHFDGIIDIYDENPMNLAQARENGVVAIMHQTSRGTYRKDSAYAERKKIAMDAGFLFGGFHLISNQPVQEQVDFLLNIEPLSDPNVAIAIDWEEEVWAEAGGPADFEHMHDFIVGLQKHLDRLSVGRYPIIYGGELLRAHRKALARGDVFSQCPLWYDRYARKFPLGAPEIWDRVALYQFNDEHRCYGPPPPKILNGADINRFYGTPDQLKAIWPFNKGWEQKIT